MDSLEKLAKKLGITLEELKRRIEQNKNVSFLQAWGGVGVSP